MRDNDQLHPIPGTELGEDPRDVGLRGERAEHQALGDLGVGQPLGDEDEDLALPRGELGAAYGFLVLFWQQGHGSSLVYGTDATGSVKAWIPIVVFAFFFGLSMDYEVIVLSRIREEYDRSGSTDEAIAQALARTGRLITSGALILALSFLSIGTDPDIIVRMIATPLAFGILLDAVIVRTLVVPALVALMGRWNWWMPHGLSRLLRLGPIAAAPPGDHG
jgi:RND superfamily putative drug exporter